MDTVAFDPRDELLKALRNGVPELPQNKMVARPFAAVEVTLEDGTVVVGNALDFIRKFETGRVAVWFPSPGQITVKGTQVNGL